MAHWLTHGEWVMSVLTAIYVLLTGFYAWTSHKTLKAIQGQADAAVKDSAARNEQFVKQLKVSSDAAEAARLNAQALINAERPWVMVQINIVQMLMTEDEGRLHGKYGFQLTMFNYGKTPAHILDCKTLKFDFLENPDNELPLIPQYGASDREQRFLAPNDSLPLGSPFNPHIVKVETVAERAARGERTPGDLVAYGMIEYGDGVSEKSYKTAFCYRRDKMSMSSMVGHLVLCGPRIYNEYT